MAKIIPIFTYCFMLWFVVGIVTAQLSSDFYATTCPDVLSTIKTQIDLAVNDEPRMGASLLRLHFHDCFVQASSTSSIFFIFVSKIYI